MNETLARQLEKAADLIDDAPLLAQGVYKLRAWMNGGAAEDRRFCYCAVGAIREVIPALDEYVDACGYVAKRLGIAKSGEKPDDVLLMNWNDDEARTKDQVSAALRETAKELMAK